LKHCLFAALTIGFFMTMSCKKGDTGPVGPAGPDSVMYSGWTTLNMDGTVDQYSGDSVYLQTITAAAITSDILARGSVIGYLLMPSPLSGDSSIINASLALQEYFAVGRIDLVSYSGDWSGASYRYVVIPAKVAVTGQDGTTQTYTREQMSLMDYSTLTGLLHLPAQGSGVSRTLSTTN
jgi:hypothetical protein